LADGESKQEDYEELVLKALRIVGEILDDGEIVQVLEKASLALIPLAATK